MPDSPNNGLPADLAETLAKGALHRERASWARLRRHFFAGLLVVTPLGVTAWIFSWLVNLVDGNARRFLASLLTRFGLNYDFNLFGREYSAIPFGFGILIVFVGICFIGMITGNFIGHWILRLMEATIRRVPGVNWIYSAVAQVSHAFLNRSRNVFEGVIYVEFPRPGIFGIGFITASNLPHPTVGTGKKVNAVFIPKTPNPTAGFILLIPEEECLPCQMTVEEAMKVVISGGVVIPTSLRTPVQAVGHEPHAGEV